MIFCSYLYRCDGVHCDWLVLPVGCDGVCCDLLVLHVGCDGVHHDLFVLPVGGDGVHCPALLLNQISVHHNVSEVVFLVHKQEL